MSYIILGLLRVCMALKTLRCCGNASSREQKSALSTIHTLNPPPQNTSASLEGCRPSIWCVHADHKASFGTQGAISAGGGHDCGGCDAVVFCAEPTETLKNAKNT
jgi:hypothetical protein